MTGQFYNVIETSIISSSHFAEFFNVLASHTWQSTLFALATGLVAFALRANSARTRHRLWLVASCKFLIPFSVLVGLGDQLGRSTAHASNPRVAVVMEQVTRPMTVTLPPSAMAAATPGVRAWIPKLLCALWAGGFVAILGLWWIRWKRVQEIVGVAAPLESIVHQGTGIEVPVRSSTALLEPGVFGIFRPTLLLPAGIGDHLRPDQLQSILTHELSHVRHRDNLAAAVHTLVEAIFWFHPLVWWMGARLVEERERACDEEVLHAGSEPRVYAESILKVCQFYMEAPVVCVAGVTGSNLKTRIEEIMLHRGVRKLNSVGKAALTLTGAAAVAAPLLLGLLNARPGKAQSTGGESARPSFEVASIKPSQADIHHTELMIAPGGRLDAKGVTAQMLIEQAYDVRGFQITGGPGWINSDRYDITAKAEGGTNLNPVIIRSMLQSLLADRFQLVFHRESKEMPVYALVVAKGGSKLKEGQSSNPMMRQGRGELNAQNVRLDMLAAHLARTLGRTVVDRTGLTGQYDFTLTWTPDASQPALGPGPDPRPESGPAPDANGPSLFTALQEQLGLKLESQKGPVDIIHIDRLEKASAN